MKIKKLNALILTGALLVGCTSFGYCQDDEKAAGQTDIDITSGSPWIDSEIIGAITEDSDYDLKDDYAAAVNKDWILNAKLYPGYSSENVFIDNCYNETQQVKALMTMENTDNDPDLAAIQSLYNLYLDWDNRNAAGVDPMMPAIKQMEAISSLDELTAYFSLTDEERYYCNEIPVGQYVDADPNDSLHNILYILPSSLLMGDAAEYETPSDYGKLLKKTRSELIKKILIKAGYTEAVADQKIENALAFESMIAGSMFTSDESLSADYAQKTNNHVTLEELKNLQGNLPLVPYLLGCGFTESQLSQIILTEPEWLSRLSEIYTGENVILIRDNMIVHYVLDSSLSLDEECFNWALDAIKERNGISELQPVEDRAVDTVTEKLDWSTAKAYCHHYASEKDKQCIKQLCEDIVSEYKVMLQNEDFLSAETIAYACEKLDNMEVNCLYPDDDEWPDTSDISFQGKEEGGTYWEALIEIGRKNQADIRAKLNQENDRTKWDNTILPNTVNCFNIPNQNSIYILSAFCQGDLYNSDMLTEELYGILGCVIGHEISHSFDSSGAQYDKDGNLANWWPEEDLKTFNEKNQKMIDYYDSISPWEGEHVHGVIVTGEAGADMAGMKVMLQMAEKIDGFDYDQFFRAYDFYYTSVVTLETEKYYLTDEHPLDYLRANVTLAQFEKFFETYGIKEGDGMYIAPENRVIIW